MLKKAKENTKEVINSLFKEDLTNDEIKSLVALAKEKVKYKYPNMLDENILHKIKKIVKEDKSDDK